MKERIADVAGAPRGGVEVRGLAKSFPIANERLWVLRGLDFSLPPASRAVIVGPSGSGKSTLLHVLGGLERAEEGSVRVDDIELGALSETALARYRNLHVGFVFQDHHLLPQHSVLQNVLLPTLVAGPPGGSAHRGGAEDRARELLAAVGLAHRLRHRPAELSGGERQRAALARALINRPKLLLCDEPTGNLDVDTARVVADLLFDLQSREDWSLIAVTHSLELAARFERGFRLDGGALRPESAGGS